MQAGLKVQILDWRVVPDQRRLEELIVWRTLRTDYRSCSAATGPVGVESHPTPLKTEHVDCKMFHADVEHSETTKQAYTVHETS